MKRVHENISDGLYVAENGYRDRMDILRSRLGLLSGTDKVLMTMYVQNGISFRHIASIRGVSETSVSRQVRKIAKRLTDGEYIRCLRNSEKLTPDQMAIAKDFFLTGLAMTRIAAKRSSSVHRVRRTLLEIRSLIGGATSQRDRLSVRFGSGKQDGGKP